MSKAKYEAVVIFSVKNEENVSVLKEKYKAFIEANGTLDSVDEWGKRRLAYDINYESEGYYMLYRFEADTDFPAEFGRISNITDGVIRAMVVNAIPVTAPVKAAEPVAEAPVEAAAEAVVEAVAETAETAEPAATEAAE